MTNKEYITKSLNGLNISDDDIEIIMLKGSVNADAPADANAFYAALCNELGVENVLVNRPKVRDRSNFW